MNDLFFLITLITASIGLIINETAMVPPRIAHCKHMTAQFGVQRHDPKYQRSAPLVAVIPANGCGVIKNAGELRGAIVLVKMAEIDICHFTDQALNVERYGGIGMVVGNIEDTLIWMKPSYFANVNIPCVFVTKTTYDRALIKYKKQPAGSVIATISKDGDVPPPKLWSFPDLMQIVT
jgi:hypothetical protein